MKKSTRMTEGARTNHTGMSTSSHAEAMNQVPKMTQPSRDNGGLRQTHASYLRDAHTLGTVPPPSSAKGAGKAALQAIKGNKAIALVDKTAERLAFERTGVRLYDALLDKMDASSGFSGGPSMADVQTIRDEELQHALMLKETLEQLGADPTAITPSADLVAVEGMGLGAVLGDPRTTVGQCLHAIIVAELADNEGWTMLRTLAEEMGQKQLATRFEQAEQQEQRHLAQVRSWLTAHTQAEAQIG
ncbi:MAG: ferritin Dps family protein [Pseudomonadales bacterium]